MESYTEKYYSDMKGGSQISAEEIVPIILELAKPKSVIEIGCALGSWLTVFKEHGINDILGVDGEWVDRNKLEIPQDKFIQHDLEKPFRIDRQFDLVLCLETAEHISGRNAEVLIDSLVRLGPIVLFTAAIPFSPGVNHVNEQWPDYWAKLFQNKKYVVVDCIRKRIWKNNKVEWWYRQNLLLFVSRNYLEKNPLLKKEYENTAIDQLSLVHPKNYLDRVKTILGMQQYITLKRLFRLLPIAIKNSLLKTFKKSLYKQSQIDLTKTFP